MSAAIRRKEYDEHTLLTTFSCLAEGCSRCMPFTDMNMEAPAGTFEMALLSCLS